MVRYTGVNHGAAKVYYGDQEAEQHKSAVWRVLRLRFSAMRCFPKVTVAPAALYPLVVHASHESHRRLGVASSNMRFEF
jgi:hypothetical protein